MTLNFLFCKGSVTFSFIGYVLDSSSFIRSWWEVSELRELLELWELRRYGSSFQRYGSSFQRYGSCSGLGFIRGHKQTNRQMHPEPRVMPFGNRSYRSYGSCRSYGARGTVAAVGATGATSLNRLVIYHERSWKIMIYHEKQPGFVMKNHQISPNAIKYHQRSPKMFHFNMVTFGDLSWKIMISKTQFREVWELWEVLPDM